MSLAERLRELERQGIDLVAILGGDIAITPHELQEILRGFPRGGEDRLYSELLFQLTMRRFDEAEAAELWRLVARHKERLNVELKRNVGFRVALLDYLSNKQTRLRDVRILASAEFDAIMAQVYADSLTGVHNRGYFAEQFTRELERAQRYSGKVSLLLLDIDNFKLYNDTRGHVAGDDALKAIAACLKTTARATDVVCRYGGDEFAIICPRTVKHDALTLADRLRRAVKLLGFVPHLRTPVEPLTLSVGVATYPDDADGTTELVQIADKALYRAKEESARLAGFAPSAPAAPPPPPKA
jgi:diguanylate cyclase (GGDEF)-like protein